MSENNNPYSTPEANLVNEATDSSGVAAIKQFPRFTTWAVVGLSIITLGIYSYYWLYSRTKILNRLIPENPIAKWLPPTTIGLVLAHWLISILPLVMDLDAMNSIMFIAPLVSIATVVLFLMWVFGFRNRINQITGAQKGNMFWLGGILTFFINVYYFQYKINEMHDKG